LIREPSIGAFAKYRLRMSARCAATLNSTASAPRVSNAADSMIVSLMSLAIASGTIVHLID
jgi:hypothetical protein